MAAPVAVEAAPDRPRRSATAVIRVLIADNHAIFREGLKRVLASTAELEVVAEAASATELVALAGKLRPDVVLLEVMMLGRDGSQTLREIKRCSPSTNIVILTYRPEDQLVLRCLWEGAAGYITKDAVPEELVAALRRVAAGGKYVNVRADERPALRRNFAGRPVHESLSRREMQVLVQIAAGRMVSEIAGDLHLSIKTVSTYRVRMLKKLKLRNNCELVRFAVEVGLLQ
jgi:two-component system invasion response regulator UvrY